MRSFNRVMLMGHLAADPEVRETKAGHRLANFALATNRLVVVDGEKTEATDFHRVIAWQGLANVAEKYLVKGSALLVEGAMINRSFEDKDGKRHFRTEVVADKFNIISWKKGRDGKDKVAIDTVEEGQETKSEYEEEVLV